MLLEVFKRLPPPTDAIRCAAVCRRWRRTISSGARAGCLPTPPRHFGFFRNYHQSPLPPFVATESGVGVRLDVGGLLPRVVSKRGVDIVDGRGGLLVLRERSKKFWELNLVLCSPLQRSYRRLPPVNISGYDMACAPFFPLQGVGSRVAVVLFGGAENLWRRYAVLVYDSASASPAWKVTTGSRQHGERHYNAHEGPSVVVGDVVYSLQDEHIMVVDTTKMTMSVLREPVARPDWLIESNHWIGKTEDARLCFFVFHDYKPLLVERWALGADGKWTLQQPLRLPPDLHGVKLTTGFNEMSSSFKRVRFAGFCEGSRMLFFVMDDWVVSFDIETLEMERLWCCETDEPRRLGGLSKVYPYEMVPWPPVLKDFAH
ncbi:hypothetical protein CFC21_076074 [Triticum aestivum]|uniref:Uncharacterized protein n=3 Tax=Triticinae TaxID=1648030 RepID=A0A3B6MLG1_WHEAT|nr:hypothetical protein CFC21_076074 [Triticum aestivum]